MTGIGKITNNFVYVVVLSEDQETFVIFCLTMGISVFSLGGAMSAGLA